MKDRPIKSATPYPVVDGSVASRALMKGRPIKSGDGLATVPTVIVLSPR